jgi:aromatic ring-opening dioxygenase catalytic subunit (LigB family)
MSIVGAAFLPHTPLLLPTTNPTHAKRVRALRLAVEEVVAWGYAAQPDIVICFNPHAPSVGNQYTFNLAERYTASFDEFGDLSTKVTLNGAPTFAYTLKEHLEAFLPVASVIEPRVNYGLGIPAIFFQKHHPQLSWIEISARHTTLKDHLAFGARLQTLLLNSRKRVLILATGEITARLTDASTQGKSPEAAHFKKLWLDALKHHSLRAFLETVTTAQTDEVASCGSWSVAQMLGTVLSMNKHVRVLYDDAPYGVGYAIATWQPA